MHAQVDAIGFVEAVRRHAEDDFWGDVYWTSVMEEFLPRQQIRQPAWSHELMREYGSRKQSLKREKDGDSSSSKS